MTITTTGLNWNHFITDDCFTHCSHFPMIFAGNLIENVAFVHNGKYNLKQRGSDVAIELYLVIQLFSVLKHRSLEYRKEIIFLCGQCQRNSGWPAPVPDNSQNYFGWSFHTII